MGDFMNKAKDFAKKHEKQVEQGLQKAGEQVNKRTGGKYAGQVDKATQEVRRRTGEGEQPR